MSKAIIPTREELECFIYERHKDAYGVKGRHYDFESMSYDELEAEAIRIDDIAAAEYKRERSVYADTVRAFRGRIAEVRQMCKVSKQTAIEFIIEGEGHTGEYDPSYICYCMGLPYSMAKYIEPALKSLNTRMESMLNAEEDLALSYYEELA